MLCFWAGKTTLLQILGTLDKPSVEKRNRASINNENILTMNDKSLSNLEFRFYLSISSITEFTALENVCIPLLINRKTN
jgi:lipoprotein-releasing system ATP-binding protein